MANAKHRKRWTYRAATAATFDAAAGAAMFFVITGSATRKLYVHKVRVSGLDLTTLASISVVCEKRSTAPSGGTAVALTAVPLETGFPTAAPTLIQVYTAAPTEGTLVGTLGMRMVLAKSATIVDGAPLSDVEFVFGDSDDTYPVMLSGAAEGLNLAFAASPATPVTCAVEVEWTEET